VFGRARQEPDDLEDLPPIEPRRPIGDRRRSVDTGPFDAEEPAAGTVEGGLDFGSLRVPIPARAQLQVEHSSGELLRAVHVLMPSGRVSLSALAAPRSTPLWRELSQEIADSLARDGARVRSEWGEWGREVQAESNGALSRFIGVDGPRWMLYGVATGPADGAGELAEALREMIRGTVVTRGLDPLPVKTVLPLRLPEHLEERVEQARQQSREPAQISSVPPESPALAAPPRAPHPAQPSVPPSWSEQSSPGRPVPPPPGSSQPAASGRSARIGWPGDPAPPSVPPRPTVPPEGPATGAPAAWPAAAASAGIPSPTVPVGTPGWSSNQRPSRFDGPSAPGAGHAAPVGSPPPIDAPRTGGPSGYRRPGLPPVPVASALDANGVSTPPMDATWTFARPVVSADQVAQQPAWAQLSGAPAFWPEQSKVRRPEYPPPVPEHGSYGPAQPPPGQGRPAWRPDDRPAGPAYAPGSAPERVADPLDLSSPLPRRGWDEPGLPPPGLAESFPAASGYPPHGFDERGIGGPGSPPGLGEPGAGSPDHRSRGADQWGGSGPGRFDGPVPGAPGNPRRGFDGNGFDGRGFDGRVPGSPPPRPAHGAHGPGGHGQPPVPRDYLPPAPRDYPPPVPRDYPPPAPRDYPPPADYASPGPRHRPAVPDTPRTREPRNTQRSPIDSTDALHMALTTDSAVTQDRLPRVERRRRYRPE
jgi:uncharacterized protein DUF3710